MAMKKCTVLSCELIAARAGGEGEIRVVVGEWQDHSSR